MTQTSWFDDAQLRGKDIGHANRGMGLERLIQITNDYYCRMGIAVVQKIPTKFLPIRDERGKVCAVKGGEKSTVDFVGRLYGRPVAFEAKSCTGNVIALDRLKPHQEEFLRRWGPEGIGFVLVSFDGDTSAFCVPFRAWEWALGAATVKHSCELITDTWEFTATGKKSIRADEMPQAWSVPIGKHGIDWADTVMRLWEVQNG